MTVWLLEEPAYYYTELSVWQITAVFSSEEKLKQHCQAYRIEVYDVSEHEVDGECP